MEQLHRTAQDVCEHAAGVLVVLSILDEKAGLYDLDIPVAQHAPKEIVKLGKCDAKLIFVEIFRDLGREPVKF